MHSERAGVFPRTQRERLLVAVVLGLLGRALAPITFAFLGPESPLFIALTWPVLVAAVWLGPAFGAGAALLAIGDIGTGALLSNLTCVIYLAEAVAVGALWRRAGSILVADVLFWISLGPLLDFALYGGILGLPANYIAVLLAKQLLNGVFVVVAVKATLYFVRRWTEARTESDPLPKVVTGRIVVLVMVPLALGALATARSVSGTQRAAYVAALQERASRAGDAIDQRLRGYEQDLALLGQRSVEDPSGTLGAASLLAFHERHPEYFNLYVTDRDGTVLAAAPTQSSAGTSLVGRSVATRPYFIAAKQSLRGRAGPLIRGRLGVRRNSPEWILAVSQPMVDARGEFNGIVYGALDVAALEDLTGATASRSVRRRPTLTILDKNLRVVASSDTRRRPGDASVLLASELGTGAGDVYVLPNRSDSSAIAALGIAPRLVVARTLIGGGLVLAEVSYLSLYWAMLPAMLAIVFGMAGAVLLAWFVTRDTSRRITAPMLAAHRVAGAIANHTDAAIEDDLASMRSSRVAEVEELADHFEVMSGALRARQAAAASERAHLELQLMQAQKLEGIGQLAGGVAHDLNNLLTPILGYADLLVDPLKGQQGADDLAQIKLAATRAKELVKQLLAFARGQVLEMRVVSPADVVHEFTPLLRRTLKENVRMRVLAAPTAGFVRADSSQLQQVLMNLAINAADAMPSGGDLTIEVRRCRAPLEGLPGNPEATEAVEIAVRDTGTGMDELTLRRVFEPFFTTKPRGKGTGLGLSMVYGIVQQHGGTVRVESTLGVGTTIRVILPLAGDARASGAIRAVFDDESDAPTAPPATILVAEDEDAVRSLVVTALVREGHTILSAANGELALEAAAAHQGAIDLLLTDVIMPGMNGRQLAAALHEARPATRVLYMSGYTSDVLGDEKELPPGTGLIAKPFTVAELTAAVRSALEVAVG